MAFRRILIAVDGSPISERALETGLELAKATSGAVGLVHVVDPGKGYAPEDPVLAREGVGDAERAARALLDGLAAKIAPSPEVALLRGSPAAEIAKHAAAFRADVVVVGTHGRSGIARALLGSVAEGLVREAPCPVLVVRSRA